MAKVKTSFICQQCGVSSHAYLGRCPGCGAWNSMIETIEERPQPARSGVRRPAELPQPLTALGATAIERIPVPNRRWTRAEGGCREQSSYRRDPGIGKSTRYFRQRRPWREEGTGLRSADESAQQIRLRAIGTEFFGEVPVLWEGSRRDSSAPTPSRHPCDVDSLPTVSVDEIIGGRWSLRQGSTARFMNGERVGCPDLLIGNGQRRGHRGPGARDMVERWSVRRGARSLRVLGGHESVRSTMKWAFEMAEWVAEVRNLRSVFSKRSDNATVRASPSRGGNSANTGRGQALTTPSAFGLPA